MFIYHLYNEPQENSIIEMDYDKVHFMLATGLNFVDHFEPEIKMIGLKLFNCMLYKKVSMKNGVSSLFFLAGHHFKNLQFLTEYIDYT